MVRLFTARPKLEKSRRSKGSFGRASNVDTRDDCGRTALHCATESGHIDAMQSLLLKGADIEAQDAEADRPLRMAVVWQQPTEMVQMLLDNGANTETTHHGITVLHAACAMGANEVV